MPLEILFRDNDYIAIHKPSGLLVHRSPVDRHETTFAIQMLRDQIGQHVYPAHRLDKPTSGILVFGLSPEAATRLQQQFADREISKTYLAVVRGHTAEKLMIDYPVKAIQDKYDPIKSSFPKDGITGLTTLARCELDIMVDEKYPKSRYSLVKLNPLTGRRHQLRYHMKHISHPIIGDAKYGKGLHNRFFENHFNCSRLLLAACQITFNHPFTNEVIHVKSLPSADFCHIIRQLGWQSALDKEALA